jgi:hypothetical protein
MECHKRLLISMLKDTSISTRKNLIINPLCILVPLADRKSGLKLTNDKDLDATIFILPNIRLQAAS